MKKTALFLIFVLPILLIAACESKTSDSNQAAQNPQPAAQACPEWSTVIEKTTASSNALKESGSAMNSPTCETIDKAVSASAQVKEITQWLDTNLCRTTCFSDMPNKQNICNNINMDSMNSRHSVLVAFKGTCK